MSKATLKQIITETRISLIQSITDFQLDCSDNREITLYDNNSNELADSIDEAYSCDVSMTKWYQDNFSEISNQEIADEISKRFNGEVEVLNRFDKMIVKF